MFSQLKTINGRHPYVMYKMNEIIKISKDDFEDNRYVFSWRIQLARDVTKKVYYDYWKKNKTINYLSAYSTNNQYNYRLTYYDRTKKKLYYWSIYANKYYLSVY